MFAPNTTLPTGEPLTKYTPGPAVLLTDTTAWSPNPANTSVKFN